MTRQLFQWEMEMHGNNKLDVVKCWRLHLGASDLTNMVIDSVADEKTLASRCKVPKQWGNLSLEVLLITPPGILLPCEEHVPKMSAVGFQQSL